MIQYSFLDSVMDAKDHLKNEAKLKKMMRNRKHFIHFILVFIFLFFSISLNAQFDNEKYDKESFLIGTLNESMGGYKRTFTNRSDFSYQRVDRMVYQRELRNVLFIDSLFNLDFSDITIVYNGDTDVRIYSPTLSIRIDDYFDYEFTNSWSLEGDSVYRGVLKKEMFKTEKQKFSFLLGVYVRYGRDMDRTNLLIQSFIEEGLLEGNNEYENVFAISNSPTKSQVCIEILKDFDCNAEYVIRQTTFPRGHYVFFISSNKIREVVNEGERLKKHIETIDTSHIEFTINGSKYIWDEPEKP